MINNIEPNIKPSHNTTFIERITEDLPLKKIERITQLALPLLNLYQPTALMIAAGSGVLQSSSHLIRLSKALKNQEGIQACTIQSLQLALTITSLAGSVFQSRMALVVTASYELALDIQELSKHQLWTQNGKINPEAQKTFFQAIRHTIHLASVIAPSPQMVFISLLAQTIFEGYEIYANLLKDKTISPETVVKIIVLTVHSYQLNQQWQVVKADIVLREQDKVTKQLVEDFHIYKQKHENQTIKFAHFLKEHNGSDYVTNANFSKALANKITDKPYSSLFEGVDFSDLSLINCNFEGLNLQNVRLTGHIHFCNFQKSILAGAHFQECKISGSQFQYANMAHAVFSQTSIKKTNFTSTLLNDAEFNRIEMDDSIFKQALCHRVKFTRCKWNNCNLDKAVLREARLIQSQMINTVAAGINLTKSLFISCKWTNCQFTDAIFRSAQMINLISNQVNLSDAIFNYAHLSHVQFDQTTLNYASFHDARLSETEIKQSTLIGTSFLNTQVAEKTSLSNSCKLTQCDLTDCLFFETKEKFITINCTDNIITRPIVGISWNSEVPGFTVPKVYRSVKAFEGIPLRLDYLPDNINLQQLDAEVKAEIAAIHQLPEQDKILSIPAEIIKRAKPGTQIYAIKQKAENYVNQLGALILPGGNNIEGEFFGGERVTDPSQYDPDYRRSLFEFAMLYAATDGGTKSNKPILGICRGNQLLNVFFGGTIRNVEGQWGKIQQYFVNTGTLLGELIGRVIIGYSTHRQAIDKLGKGFTVAIEFDGIIKAVENVTLKVFGFQFHPEWVLDRTDISLEENAEVIKRHIEYAKNPQTESNILIPVQSENFRLVPKPRASTIKNWFI